MIPNSIRHKLLLRGKKVTPFARGIGFHPQTVYRQIRGEKYYPNVAKAISKALNEPLKQTWGDLYPNRFEETE